jgi:hypothetical protein
MLVAVEWITPMQAKQYLETNHNNRTLRKSVVAEYACEMVEGNWKLTHQGIAFDLRGNLLDGQHRLAAIVEAGIAVQMLVVRGLATQDQLVMDDHAKRSASDALSFVRGEPVNKARVSIIRAAIECSDAVGVKRKVTKQELHAVLDEFRPAVDFVLDAMPNLERGVTAAPVRAAIALAWFYVDNVKRLAWFCDVLTGRELPDGGMDRAAIVLREWLLRNGVVGEAARNDAFKKTQRAIVAFQKHQDIGKLYGTVNYFAWPLNDPARRN